MCCLILVKLKAFPHTLHFNLRFTTKCVVQTLQRVLQQSTMLSLIVQLARSVGGVNFSRVTLDEVLPSTWGPVFKEGMPMTLTEPSSMV